MTFQPGHKLSKGRPKGSINIRTREAQAIMQSNKFCPIESMMKIHEIALRQFVEEQDKLSSGRISPMESEASKYLATAAKMASDLACYAHPRLKSIEQKRENPFSHLPREEKVAALKQALRMLEAPDEPRDD